MNVGVIGSGTWGTALAILLHNNGHKVMLWSAISKEAEQLRTQRIHPNLPQVSIPESIEITENLEDACKSSELLVIAVPSIFIRQTAAKMHPYVSKGQIVVNVAKGIEAGTLDSMTDIIEEEVGQADVAVLSGPSHAEEVSRGLPTVVVVGAHREETAKKIQETFMSDVFRVYISSDMKGIETAAALKNVIALAAGMADGIGYGDNTKAALITRGIAEISRLGIAMKSEPVTFYGLAGIGDLIVTCASMHSRNRRAGILMGQGKSMEEATEEVGMVVEGIHAAKAALELAEKYKVNMPIVQAVGRVLFEDYPVQQAVSDLMLRDKAVEHPTLGFEH